MPSDLTNVSHFLMRTCDGVRDITHTHTQKEEISNEYNFVLFFFVSPPPFQEAQTKVLLALTRPVSNETSSDIYELFLSGLLLFCLALYLYCENAMLLPSMTSIGTSSLCACLCFGPSSLFLRPSAYSRGPYRERERAEKRLYSPSVHGRYRTRTV